MDTFLDNAQRILEVARSAEGNGAEEFALVIRPDGGLHFLMESPVSIEAASAYAGAESTYRVVRSHTGIRVEGRSYGHRCSLRQSCVLEQRNHRIDLLRDPALYVTGPTLAAIDRA